MVYIGYLLKYFNNEPVLLCVSNEKWKVKNYLKEVRGLDKNEYEIREVVLDYQSAIALYEDYILYDYDENHLVLTAQDIEYVNTEINTTISQMERSYEELQKYYDMIKNAKLKDDLNPIIESINLMEKHLTKVKTMSKICNSVLEDSPIFSKNILTYLKCIRYLQEDRELTELFYRRVNE